MAATRDTKLAPELISERHAPYLPPPTPRQAAFSIYSSDSETIFSPASLLNANLQPSPLAPNWINTFSCQRSILIGILAIARIPFWFFSFFCRGFGLGLFFRLCRSHRFHRRRGRSLGVPGCRERGGDAGSGRTSARARGGFVRGGASGRREGYRALPRSSSNPLQQKG